MTSSKSNLLKLAKQGDARAIAALINRQLQPRGVTAKVALKDGCLQVILEAEKIPERGLAAWVQKGITALESDFVQSVKVCGRQAGESSIAWGEKFEISKPTSPPIDSRVSKNSISDADKDPVSSSNTPDKI